MAVTLAAALLVASTVWVTPAYVPIYMTALRTHRYGAELRAQQLAEHIDRVADEAGVPVALLAALIYDESGLNAAAVSPVGAVGLPQLNVRGKFWRAWRRSGGTEYGSVLQGALALREAMDACGDEHGATGFYRSGMCLRGPRGAHTLAVARWIAAAMGEP